MMAFLFNYYKKKYQKLYILLLVLSEMEKDGEYDQYKIEFL